MWSIVVRKQRVARTVESVLATVKSGGPDPRYLR